MVLTADVPTLCQSMRMGYQLVTQERERSEREITKASDAGLGFRDVEVPAQPEPGAKDDEGHLEKPEQHTDQKRRQAAKDRRVRT